MARKNVDELWSLAAKYEDDIVRLGKKYLALDRKITKLLKAAEIPHGDNNTPSLAKLAGIGHGDIAKLCHARQTMAAHITELAIDAARMRETAGRASSSGQYDASFRRNFKTLLDRDF